MFVRDCSKNRFRSGFYIFIVCLWLFVYIHDLALYSFCLFVILFVWQGKSFQGNKYPFSDYKRHFANIRETLLELVQEAAAAWPDSAALLPVITGSGGLTLASHLGIPFVQEVIAVSTALRASAP